MNFDNLFGKIINETKASEARLDNLAKLHKIGQKMSDAEAAYVVIKDALNSPDGKQYEGDYIAAGKELKDGGMGRDEYSLETLQKALEYAKQDGWEFDIEAILDQLDGPTSYKDDYEREEHQDDEYKGWPGDGSGEDDFQDLNQNEADHEREVDYGDEEDYYNESKGYLRNVVNEAYANIKSDKECPIFGGPMKVILHVAEDIEHIAKAVEDGTVNEDNLQQLYGIAAEMREYYEKNK